MVCLVSWPLNGSVGTVSASSVGGCWAQALEGRQHQHPPCREQTQVSIEPSIRPMSPPHIQPCPFLGREPDPSEKSVAPVEGTPGFLVGSAQRSLEGWGHCAQLALQLAGMAGGGDWLILQSEGLPALRPLPRWERSPLPRILHPTPPCLTTTGLQGHPGMRCPLPWAPMRGHKPLKEPFVQNKVTLCRGRT